MLSTKKITLAICVIPVFTNREYVLLTYVRMYNILDDAIISETSWAQELAVQVGLLE